MTIKGSGNTGPFLMQKKSEGLPFDKQPPATEPQKLSFIVIYGR